MSNQSTRVFLVVLVLALLIPVSLSSCAPAPTATPVPPTQAPPTAVPPTTVPPTPTPSSPPPAPALNFQEFGYYPRSNHYLDAGEGWNIVDLPYIVEIDEGTFDVPVKFELLFADHTTMGGLFPATETPVYAFAMRVTNTETGELIGAFNKPVQVIIVDGRFAAGKVKYYNMTKTGLAILNAQGLAVQPGVMKHPVEGAGASAWAVTIPQ